ncbi:MAG: response regulator [Magnetococcales bacterium]|nr:response regulator [Magnetococcales bacterium]
MKILIVDDVFENRKLLQDLLVDKGQCELVSNGQDALDLFEAAIEDGTCYDLVLLDIMMPGLDGQDVLKIMRSTESEQGIDAKDEAVIIMVTAVNAPRHVLDAFFQGGCTDYIAKPISRDALFDKLQEYKLL